MNFEHVILDNMKKIKEKLRLKLEQVYRTHEQNCLSRHLRENVYPD